MEDGFRLSDQYDLGDELVVEEEMNRPDRYASAWNSPTAPPGDAPSGATGGETPIGDSGLEDESGST